MSGKIIYVDFKSASKKSKLKKNLKNNNSHPDAHKDNFIKAIYNKIKHAFYKFFKRDSNDNDSDKYKHWL